MPDASPDTVAPEDCREMAEVRAGIDALDAELVALLSVRQRYIEAAGRIKPQKSEVRLPWRIEEVVEKVLARADAAGLSRAIAEPVWRELIDRCIAHEHGVWDARHNAGGGDAESG